MPFASYARGTRRAFAALNILVVVVAGGCGSSDNKPSATSRASTTSTSSTSSITSSSSIGTLVEITVAAGQVAGGVKHVQVDVGSNVTIRITSDVAEGLHVHGYDLKRDLTPGAPVELTFTADIPGVFDVELEHAGLKIAELQVG
jgi:hypothetical protein